MSTLSTEGSFNELIHAPMRFRICGLLRSVHQLDFAVLRDTLDISDPTLSKHLRLLSDAGIVGREKIASMTRSDSRRITWLSLTAHGKRSFDGHLEALRAISAGFGPAQQYPAELSSSTQGKNSSGTGDS